MKCTVCQNPQVSEVDVLLAGGSSIRTVARMFALSRTTLSRHARHIAPASTKFAVIRGQDDPGGPPDPLAEAFLLAERARTPRERLRALEQVRSATKLKLRGVLDPESEDRELLDGNVAQAEAAYRDAGDFETAARALSGWREALRQRLDAAKTPDAIEVNLVTTLSDGEPTGGGGTIKMRPEHYWRGVPVRFRDAERYIVERTIHLSFLGKNPSEEIKVRERERPDVLAWSN